MHGHPNVKFYVNFNVFDMFRTSKCSSSGRLVHEVLWYFFHAEIIINDYMNSYSLLLLGRAEGEHVNRGRDTPSFCPTFYLLICSFLLCLSWLLRSWVRKFRRDLQITLYMNIIFVNYIWIHIVFLRMNTWMFETCRRHYNYIKTLM